MSVLIAVPSSVQSFFQSWNDYKCNCHPQNPNAKLFTSTIISLVSVSILVIIVLTIGWIWTCKIAIKRGKLIKKKGEISHLQNVRSKYKSGSYINIISLSYIQKMPFLCQQTMPTVSTPYQLKIRYLK